MEKLENPTLGSYNIEPELKHRHTEAFYEALNGKEIGGHSGPYGDRAIIESAVASKILLDKVDVMEASPALTKWLAGELIDYVNKSRNIPKN